MSNSPLPKNSVSSDDSFSNKAKPLLDKVTGQVDSEISEKALAKFDSIQRDLEAQKVILQSFVAEEPKDGEAGQVEKA